jgi:signal peptidase I
MKIMSKDKEKSSSKPQSRKAWLVENVVSMGSALLIVFMIRSSIIEAFKIPSGSMIPTLFVGDHIFVNKFAYGLKIPFSDWVTDHPIYLIKRDLPKRGDVIVFKYPRDESLYYIKRVVGVPGDRVEMKNKVLYVNQQIVSQDRISESQTKQTLQSLDDPNYPEAHMTLYTEHLNAIHHTVMIDNSKHLSEDFGPVTVPEGSLFAMGDNRDWSGDSRYWGFVPMKNVRGKALFIWLSLWVDLSEGFFTFKPSRIGTLIQ